VYTAINFKSSAKCIDGRPDTPCLREMETHPYSICCVASHYLSHRGVGLGHDTKTALKVKGQGVTSSKFNHRVATK